MKRRALLLAGTAWLATATARAFSQSANAPRRVAILNPGSEAGFRALYDTFIASLKSHGHVVGRDFSIDVRWAEDQPERLEKLAAELLALRPDVVLTAGSAAIAVLKKATSTVPVVFAAAFDPVEQGFIHSLRHPGGNITGVIVHRGLTAKIIEMAREALPAARRLGFLVYEPDPVHRRIVEDFETTAPRFKFDPVIVRLRAAENLDRAFTEFVGRKADAVILPQLTFFVSARREIAQGAIAARLPLLSVFPSITESGGLLSYGTDPVENYRRAASLVDRILRGAKPGELPVEQPERFQLIINLKTARAIGVKLSETTLARADRIIE